MDKSKYNSRLHTHNAWSLDEDGSLSFAWLATQCVFICSQHDRDIHGSSNDQSYGLRDDKSDALVVWG